MEKRPRSNNELIVAVSQNQRLNYKEFSTQDKRIVYPVWNPELNESCVHPIDSIFPKPAFYVQNKDRILPGYPWLEQSRSNLPGFFSEMKGSYDAISEKYQLNEKSLSRDLIPTIQANKQALEDHLGRYEAWLEELGEELKLILLAWLHLVAPESNDDLSTREAWLDEAALVKYRFRIEDVLLKYDSGIEVDSLSPEELFEHPEWIDELKKDAPLRHLYFQIRCIWNEAVQGSLEEYLRNWFAGLTRAYLPRIEIENSVIEASIIEAFVFHAGRIGQFREEALELDLARAIHDIVLHRVITKKDVSHWTSILNSFVSSGGGRKAEFSIERTERIAKKLMKKKNYLYYGGITKLIEAIRKEYKREIKKSPSTRTVAAHLSDLGIHRNVKS